MCNRKREEPRAVFPRRGVWWGWSPLGPRRRGVRFRERLCNPSPAVKENRGAVERNADWAQQAAEKGPSAALARSRGAATYRPSTPRTSPPAPPCIWTFLSSLGKSEFFNTLSERAARIPGEDSDRQGGLRGRGVKALVSGRNHRHKVKAGRVDRFRLGTLGVFRFREDGGRQRRILLRSG